MDKLYLLIANILFFRRLPPLVRATKLVGWERLMPAFFYTLSSYFIPSIMKKFLLSILLLPAAWLAGAEVAQAENIFVPKKVADIAVADVTDGSKEVVIRNRITPTIFLKTSADAVHETKLPLAPNDKFRIVTTGEAGVYYIYSVAQSGYVVLKEGVSPSANGTDKSVVIQKGNPTNAAKWVIEYEKGANDPRCMAEWTSFIIALRFIPMQPV